MIHRWTALLAFLFVVGLGESHSIRAELVNVAPRGTATQSSTDFGGDASRAIDGDTNGAYGAGSVTHTAADDPEPTWEVDLGETHAPVQIKIWNRTDGCCAQRLTDFRVSVLDVARTEVYSGDFFGDGTFPDTALDGFAIDVPAGTEGQIVQVKRLGPDTDGGLWLSLAEVEVFVDIVAPSIVEQPSGAEVEEGSCHRFEVGLVNVDDAVSVTYEWKKDGEAIPGATGEDLLVSDVTSDDAGSYSVCIDVDGTVLVSDPAVLVVTPRNLARGGTATQINTAFGGTPERAIDGNTSGIFGNNSMTHTDNTEGSWWEVELRDAVRVDSIVLWSRTECCANRLSNIRVSVLDGDRVEVFGEDLFTDLSFPDTSVAGFGVDAGGVTGRFVRIERLGPDSDGNNYLSLAEVQVFGEGPPAPPLKNLARACGAVTSQSSTLGGFVADLAIDGNLGNFTHTLGPDDAATWEVELTQTEEIGAIVLHNRRSCCGSRLRDIIVTVLDEEGATVFESDLLNPENEQGAFPNGPPEIRVDLQFGEPGVVSGRTVRVRRIADPDLSGTGGEGNPDESNVLSLAEVEVCPPADCPPTGDTHCDGLTVEGPPGDRPGAWLATATGTDDSGDEVLYTFRAESDAGVITVGPGPESSATLSLGLGSWTISVTADDDPSCPDEADDATCTEQVEVVCTQGNIAVDGVASQSTTGFGGAAARAIDCNTDGVYPNGSTTHTATGDAAPWWEVDLLGSFALDRIVLWNRTDCCTDRLSNFRVSLLDGAREVVWSEDFFTDGGAVDVSLEIDSVRGNAGSIVRVDSLGPSPGGDRFLSLAEVEVFELTCPDEGDTHCDGLTVERTDTGHVATASARDDSGDEISFTFTAKTEGADPLVVGPQTENTASFDLTPGDWTVTVTVDDDEACPDEAQDATCSIDVTVPPPGGLQVPGDCNQDGNLDISDALCTFGVLFLGEPESFPCDGGLPQDPANVVLMDFNSDIKVDLSDGVSILLFLFSGGAPHPLADEVDGSGCVRISGCPENDSCLE